MSLDLLSSTTLFGTAEPTVVAEHRGVKIALTPDCRFEAVGSELFNGGKYRSLADIKKAVDARLLAAARGRSVRLLALDGSGNEREIIGNASFGTGERYFYPRVGWVADAIARVRALQKELDALWARLEAVQVFGDLRAYEGHGEDLAPDQLFDRLLADFERKRLLAEAGPDAIASAGDDE